MKLSAWLAAAAAATALPSAHAISFTNIFAAEKDPSRKQAPPAGKALWTDTVSYCSDVKDVEISAFDMTFWKENNTLTFGLSIQSMIKNFEFDANILLSAYDKPIKNLTFSMCDYFDGLLCPGNNSILPDVPNINFTGTCTPHPTILV